MYGSVDYDSDSVRNAYHHSSWYNVEFGIDCFLWSYDGGYNAGCVEITDSDHAWSVVLVIVMTRIDNDDGFVSYDDDKNVILVTEYTGRFLIQVTSYMLIYVFFVHNFVGVFFY